MPESTSHIFDQLEAALWVLRFEDGDVDIDSLPPIQGPQLIFMVAVLRRIGEPDEIAEDLAAIRRSAQALETSIRADEAKEGVRGGLAVLERWREVEFRAATAAQDILEKNGWSYDSNSGKVKHRSGKRGRPAELQTLLVGFFWELERPQYREETGDKGHNTQELRERVAFRVSAFLPEEMVDPSFRGPIDYAIRNYLRQRTKGSDGAKGGD